MIADFFESIGAFIDRPRALDESSNAFIALAGKARRTSDPVLAIFEVAGFAAAIAVIALAPNRSELALPVFSAGAFGLWGITDHAIAAHEESVNAVFGFLLEGFRATTAAAGIAAAVGFGYALVGLLMGVWVL